MSTRPRYCYAPLPSPRHTRLVILHSSKTDNYPINCDLVEVDIDGGPAYEALSYTWNDEVPSKPLEITSADGSGARSLLITTNCARALRLLRKRIGKRPCASIGLWVDAISINQSSNEERSAQVSMMAEIYHKARNVVVWLGNTHAPPNRRSMLCFQLSRPFSLLDQDTRARTRKLRWINKLFAAVSPVVKKTIEIGSSQALKLFSAPYWTRAWTLQEFPHVSTRILCLNSEGASILGIVPSNNVLEDGMDIYLHHLLLEANRRQDLAASRPRLLSMNLPNIVSLQCSDPRDKVFALRELFPTVLGGIAVDYDRDVEDLYTVSTRYLISACQNLEALYTSCSRKKKFDALGAQTEPHNMPSWAIDWSGGSGGALNTVGTEISWYWTSILFEPPHPGTVLPASFRDDGRVLRLFGKSFSQVSGCVSRKITYDKDNWEASNDFMTVIRKFLRQVSENDALSERPLGSALAELLRTVHSTVSPKLTKAESQMEAESDMHRICDLMRDCGRIYAALMRRRRLFATTDGRLGFANMYIMPGDLVCNFAGLNMPFIVRGRGEYYELISSAIVNGAMRREMWPRDEKEIVPWDII